MKKLNFAPTVIAIDAAYVNRLTASLKEFSEKIDFNAKEKGDVVMYVRCILFDAKFPYVPNNQVQVIFTYDKDSELLPDLTPSSLSTELNGVACCDAGYEFLFSSVPTEDLISPEGLFLDLLDILLESKDITQLIVVGDNDVYPESIHQKLVDYIFDINSEKKDIVRMLSKSSAVELPYRWDSALLSIMGAMDKTVRY